MYLVDTNIWLELLLEQDRWQEVKSFFEKVNTDHIHITEFAVYSIGIILSRYEKTDVFKDFITDLIHDSQVDIIRLQGEDHFKIIEAMEEYSLDFDDAYQYAAARKMNLELVSFDSDFDQTPEKKILPGQVIQEEIEELEEE
ncbi:MAG: PIN domain-containing protein [Candidatus Aminicenantes bacterium]|nr:PIN domain-containing protein [Candidatus Aminicenantes bacterium]NIM83681.1 PIN domain-containing protein [Candidatus Aminicenantes bacterium]NIN23106.1 PIN domain-containing protein [Candidatus Aminicenantes bacterium]NIN46833.1 PIN domain-containing protein [Candidatus Aminicenantes bacterium]NIN89755.1 PIN domain-containing protein [Candidatus Aminicenantes bacterium]